MVFDIHLQIIDPSEQSFGETLTASIGNAIPVTGMQALMNRWLKTFLTPKGSNPLNKDIGTEYPYLIGSNVTDASSLQALLSEYVADATEQVKKVDRQNLNLPANSRMRDTAIIQFTKLSSTEFEFWVELINQANERMTSLIPYKVSNG